MGRAFLTFKGHVQRALDSHRAKKLWREAKDRECNPTDDEYWLRTQWMLLGLQSENDRYYFPFDLFVPLIRDNHARITVELTTCPEMAARADFYLSKGYFSAFVVPRCGPEPLKALRDAVRFRRLALQDMGLLHAPAYMQIFSP